MPGTSGGCFAEYFEVESFVDPQHIAPGQIARHVTRIYSHTSPDRDDQSVTAWLEWKGFALTCNEAVCDAAGSWRLEHVGVNDWRHTAWGDRAGGHHTDFVAHLGRDSAAATVVRVFARATTTGPQLGAPGLHAVDVYIT